MITPGWCHTMALYNAWQNASLVAAAETLDDAARRADRGAFFGSIHATMSHILWADRLWMSRLAGSEAPPGGIPESVALFPDWEGYRRERDRTDSALEGWAARLEPQDIDGELHWHSAVLGRAVAKSRALCIAHMFNHQTHHRGQVHAMLTQAGAHPGPTDLFVMPDTI